MLSQKNSQHRSQSSTRIELARDLHDSLAQELVAIGFHLDLLIADLPARHRAATREIRIEVSNATKKVRRELFALRSLDADFQEELQTISQPMNLEINGEISKLDARTRRIVSELIRNAATHSKGHNIKLEISDRHISVKDDGNGMYGISELVSELGGALAINSTRSGTEVEISLP